MSRTELARRAGFSRESLYKLLRGDVLNPSIQTLQGLALALEISPIFLLRQYFDALSLGPPTLLSCSHPDDHVSFVRDVTIPDDMAVRVNERFTKTWEIQNTGALTWRGRRLICQDDDYVLAKRLPDGGLEEVMDCHLIPANRTVPIPETPPGGIASISVDFAAPPLPCSVISIWKIADDQGTLCFPEFAGIWAKVRVVSL